VIRSDVMLEDTTLRDGEQAPGVAFSPAIKRHILDRLLAVGVRSVEVGIPAMGGDELDFVASVVDRQDEARLIAWNRGVREDVERTLDLGYRAVHVGLPASDRHLASSVRRDRSWLLATARDLVSLAKDRGAFVSISAEDLARTDPAFLVEYAGVVHEAGADRLRLSDTVGMMTPEAYGDRIATLSEQSTIDLQCHAHNDFGLAVANTLAGLRAGARYFHVTLNGIGERAGMPDLAQMVAALKFLYDVDLGIKLSELTGLAREFAEILGEAVPPWQPIVGRNVFAHESGIHVNAMLRDTSSFEPFPPEEVGGERRYVLGKHSGRALIEHVLTERGLEYDDRVLAACLERTRSQAIRSGPLSAGDLEQVYRTVVTADGRG
jgi:isopropylmalate/homocitrate/citramalate synthase